MTEHAEIEYGYRLVDGTEVWAVDHDGDGTWTPYNREHNIPAIDLYDGEEVAAIRNALAKAGVEGIPIRRNSAPKGVEG